MRRDLLSLPFILLLPALSVGQETWTASDSTLTATNTSGTSAEVSPALPIASAVDLTFQPPVTNAPSAVALLPDGRVLLAGPIERGGTSSYALVRLNPDGNVDPGFTPYTAGTIYSMAVDRDGRLLVSVAIPKGGGPFEVKFVRLNQDGTVDPSFTPLPFNASPPLMLPDGRYVLVAVDQNVVTVTRYGANGMPDPTFPATTLTLAPIASRFDDPTYREVFVTRTASGSYVVAASSAQSIGTGTFGANSTILFQLRADGSVDPDYARVTLPVHMTQVVSVGEYLYYTASQRSGPLGSYGEEIVGRLTARGASDPTFATIRWSAGYKSVPQVSIQPDGTSVWLEDGLFHRYQATGRLDRDFSLGITMDPAYTQPGFALADSQSVFVWGGFTGIDGLARPYVAKLNADTHASATRLVNVSARQVAGTGAATLTLGFVIVGEGQQTLLLRGVGPALAALGVGTPLPNPNLTLIDSRSGVRATNDDWALAANAAAVESATARVGAFPLAPAAKDAALLATMPSGAYSVQIGPSGGTGIALAEAYATDSAPTTYTSARIVNFSVRAMTGSGDATLIAGFTIQGPHTKRVLIRGVGPALASFGVAGALVDPVLTVFTGASRIGSNDHWDRTAVTDAISAAGAFALPLDSHDTAIVLTLPAGAYTAQVTSASAGSGIALIEVYELP